VGLNLHSRKDNVGQNATAHILPVKPHIPNCHINSYSTEHLNFKISFVLLTRSNSSGNVQNTRRGFVEIVMQN
jgi:hypothetical protein